jgi:hypothetical protein
MSIARYGLSVCSSEIQNMILPLRGYPIRDDLKYTLRKIAHTFYF